VHETEHFPVKHGALGQNTARSRRAELLTESVQQRAEGLSAYLVGKMTVRCETDRFEAQNRQKPPVQLS